MTGASKPPLIKAMVRALERVEYQWLPDPVAKGEFEAYEERITESNNSKFNAPAGTHDDCVIARCLTLRASGVWGSLR
jgi:hypothetical protein